MSKLKEPYNLSPRIQWLRDYYFKGSERRWNNEYTCFTTGTPWDVQFNELTYYIVPEVYVLLGAMGGSFRQAARPVALCGNFWSLSLPERRAWFVREVMSRYVPKEILPGDLIAGGRFNVQTSLCLNRREARAWNARVSGKRGVRAAVKGFHDHGYGNAGATSGHIIPGYERILTEGFKGVYQELSERYAKLSLWDRRGAKGDQLRAMMSSAEMPRLVASGYADLARSLAQAEKDIERARELSEMADILKRVPWEPAANLWEAVQSLWITHMLVMSDENYPGPGVSFGRIDQYLLPFWEISKGSGMDREFAKEILKCFWIHCNTAYDAQIRTGNQGITAGFGQLITLSGLGAGGTDCTNELTYLILEVIDEMSPILEPKPNIRLHRRSPEKLVDTVTEMISKSQGAPFLLNFDERSMAGLLREARIGGYRHLISENNVADYAPVGCLENTMVGNDRSGTVDNNLNILKAVELALTGGKDLLPVTDAITGTTSLPKQDGPRTGNSQSFATFEEFFAAFSVQLAYIVRKCAALYERSEEIRSRFFPTPYLSCLVKGCAQKGLDVTSGGAEINFTTLEVVTFATAVDSLLAVKYLVFDRGECAMEELLTALRANWKGFEVLKAKALHKAPKYGRDDDEADALALRVMELICEETWKYTTRSTKRRFRPGMLSWNYWAGDGYIMAASPNGREKGQFLSNAICPSNGADINGPTSNANSVGKVLGGRGPGADYLDYVNYLPNGASHTITFNPSLLRDRDHREKFKAFLRGYTENGGTALQINILDPSMLKDAQERPEEYRHLLVRVTGYNAYFTTIGRELQNEVIARISHAGF